MQVDKLTTFNIQTAHNQAATVKSHLSQFSGIAKDEPYFSDGYQKNPQMYILHNHLWLQKITIQKRMRS